MRCRIRADHGSVTAEFAAVLPAVVLILIVALGSLQLCGEQLRLQAAVAEAARSVGRGGPSRDDLVTQVSPGAAIVERQRGDLACVTASVPAALGAVVGITLEATSCALSDGQ